MAKRKSWLVQAAKTKLPLELGDGNEWIEVKDRLTIGEQRDLADKTFGDAVPDPTPENAFQVRVEQKMASYPIYRVAMWMTDWSLVDHDGKPLPVTTANIRALEPEAFDAIDSALDKHVVAMEDANAPANPTTPQPSESDAPEPTSSDAMPSAPISTLS